MPYLQFLEPLKLASKLILSMVAIGLVVVNIIGLHRVKQSSQQSINVTSGLYNSKV
jgi:hypothetical protein